MEKLKQIKNKSGFTLIELMIVMTVIAILAAMVLFGLSGGQKSARDVQREQIVKSVQLAITSYTGDMGVIPTGGSPASWAGLTYVGPSNDAPADAARLGITYLSTTSLLDPGCGTAGGDVRGGFIAQNGVPSGCTTVKYEYKTSGLSAKCSGADYELDLTKESGGVLYFCGPK